MRHNDLFLTPRNLSAHSPEEALAKNTLGLDLLLLSTSDPQVDWFGWEPGCPVAGQRFQTVKVRQLDTSLRGLTEHLILPFLLLGGLTTLSSIRFVASLPSPSPLISKLS